MNTLSHHDKFCIVGGVSTGKSTFLNGAFCEKLTQCKIKRTTMVPTCYIENDISVDSPEHIYKIMEEKNKSIIEKTEKNTKLNEEDYKELIFNVGKLDINFIGSNGYIEIYDIPGLNDARTKEYYYNYLRENFYKFNVVIMFIDINSGLNTSDEMDMLNFIIEQTKNHKQKGREIYTLFVVNKADDMSLDEDVLIINGELKEMFDQVVQTVYSSFHKDDLDTHIIGITPFCAIDAYLYRMIKKYPDYELSDEERIKIGINEMGKKFNKYGKARQIEEVKKILKNESFISDMISLSGFKQIEKIIYEFLQPKRKIFEIENILYSIRSMQPISHAFKNDIYSDEIYTAVSEYVTIYEKLKDVDIEQYNNYMQSLLTSILYQVDTLIIIKGIEDYNEINDLDTFFKKQITRWSWGLYSQLGPCDLDNNDMLMKNIIYKYFSSYYKKIFHEDEYICIHPKIIDQAKIHILYSCFNTPLSIGAINSFILILKRIKQFNKETIERMIYAIVNNINKNETFLHIYDVDLKEYNDFIQTCDEIKEQNVDIKPLLRFLILNKLKCSKYNEKNTDELFILHMMYQNKHELPICNVISMIRQNIPTPPNIQVVIKGFVPEYLTDPKFTIDAYYLSLC
jgi:GTPase Era involved in 16S rRNA processing